MGKAWKSSLVSQSSDKRILGFFLQSNEQNHQMRAVYIRILYLMAYGAMDN